MNKKALILGAYFLSSGCRSSYDESKHKVEVAPTPKTTGNQPQVEMPAVPSSVAPTQPTTTPAKTSEDSADVTPKPAIDPGTIAVEHTASQVELTKYNCKGTALITDSGMDKNHNGLLEESEIQETRIDCTEVVPGS